MTSSSLGKVLYPMDGGAVCGEKIEGFRVTLP